MSVANLIIISIAWNFIVFLIYGIDKMKAKFHWWRVSEKTLLLLAFLMGGVGAFAGMKFFRHKTLHPKFRIMVPIAIISNIALIFFAGRLL